MSEKESEYFVAAIDGNTDSKFYDTDYDTEDGDDGIFEANVDKDPGDNNE